MDVVLFGELVTIEYIEEFIAGHLTWVTSDGTENTEQFGSFAVLGRSDPLEVGSTPVEDVSVDMIALIAFGTRSEPSEGHEHVAGSAAAGADVRVRRMDVVGSFEASVPLGAESAEAIASETGLAITDEPIGEELSIAGAIDGS